MKKRKQISAQQSILHLSDPKDFVKISYRKLFLILFLYGEKPKLKSKFFFWVISVSYKKRKETKNKKKIKIKIKNKKQKKQISYLNLKRGKECVGASSDNLMVLMVHRFFFYGEVTDGGRMPDWRRWQRQSWTLSLYPSQILIILCFKTRNKNRSNLNLSNRKTQLKVTFHTQI